MPTQTTEQEQAQGVQARRAAFADLSDMSYRIGGTSENDVRILMALVQISGKDTDEFSPFMNAHTVGTLADADLATAVTALKNEQRREKIQSAAEIIVRLEALAIKQQQGLVEEVRRARQMERNNLNALKAIQRAMNYGLATNNYLPLMSMLGMIAATSCETIKLMQVPEDWSEVPPDVGSDTVAGTTVRQRAKRSDAGVPRGPLKPAVKAARRRKAGK